MKRCRAGNENDMLHGSRNETRRTENSPERCSDGNFGL